MPAPLTGLFNRHVFESRDRALHRDGQPFTLVTAAFAEVVFSTVRATDIVCRWGGEEFTLALVDASEEHAREMLDRIRVNLEAAIHLADTALYAAKAGGRNMAVCATTVVPLGHSATTSAPRPESFPARSS